MVNTQTTQKTILPLLPYSGILNRKTKARIFFSLFGGTKHSKPATIL
jgi:hypothetical protein